LRSIQIEVLAKLFEGFEQRGQLFFPVVTGGLLVAVGEVLVDNMGRGPAHDAFEFLSAG